MGMGIDGEHLKELQEQISDLSKDDLAEFSTWFEEFQAQLWDEQFERDVQDGKLDKIADEAVEDFKSGKCTDL